MVCMQRSPPLRKGTRAKVGGKDPSEGYADMKADPGMVLNYKPQETPQLQAAAAQPDLLDFDGLSMDSPAAANNAQVRALSRLHPNFKISKMGCPIPQPLLAMRERAGCSSFALLPCMSRDIFA